MSTFLALSMKSKMEKGVKKVNFLKSSQQKTKDIHTQTRECHLINTSMKHIHILYILRTKSLHLWQLFSNKVFVSYESLFYIFSIFNMKMIQFIFL